MIVHEVFGTFLARPKGFLSFLFLPERLIHVTSYAGYPKAVPVWAEIWIALAKREILPLPASLGGGAGSGAGSRTGDACTGQAPQTERNLVRR